MSAHDDLLTALALLPAEDREVASRHALSTVRVWLRDVARARTGTPVGEQLPDPTYVVARVQPRAERDCYVLSDEEGGHG